LVAYDLNEGVIKWRVPDGNAPGLADKGIMNTGTVRPRNGPVVTAGGLVFLPNSQDRMLRAFDKDTGAVVWEHELQANPEGIPAVYEVRGRQFVAFAAGASWGTGGDPVWRDPFHRKKGDLAAQGYHVFALSASALARRASSNGEVPDSMRQSTTFTFFPAEIPRRYAGADDVRIAENGIIVSEPRSGRRLTVTGTQP
jgi:hypothetical protein